MKWCQDAQKWGHPNQNLAFQDGGLHLSKGMLEIYRVFPQCIFLQEINVRLPFFGHCRWCSFKIDNKLSRFETSNLFWNHLVEIPKFFALKCLKNMIHNISEHIFIYFQITMKIFINSVSFMCGRSLIFKKLTWKFLDVNFLNSNIDKHLKEATWDLGIQDIELNWIELNWILFRTQITCTLKDKYHIMQQIKYPDICTVYAL